MTKRTTLLTWISIGTLSVAVIGSSVWSTPEEHYTPRAEFGQNEGIYGSLAYLNGLRANQVTGEIDPAWILQARAQADGMSGKMASLTWENLGPDNGGGRTRALLVDRTNSSIVYAASVSGGIFKTTNGGATWNPVSDPSHNLAAVSLCQTANGDLFYGTGEFPYIGYGGGGGASTPAFIGGGIFKSTDGGSTWATLSATVPSASTPGGDWTSVARLEAHPTDANILYAGTSGGFKMSTNGGTSWTTTLSGMVRDMTISPSGKLWVFNSGKLMYSVDGTAGSWVEKSSPVAGTTGLPRRTTRCRVAVSPQDENVIYVVHTGAGESLNAVYRSADGGTSWSKIGQKGNNFDPLCSGSQCQGEYDLLFAVSPKDKNHIWLGGITVWEWNLNAGWRQVNTTSGGMGNPYYIHSDSHEMVFDPKNPNIAYIGNDGGIFKTSDHGLTWTERNNNYITYQYYGFGMGKDRKLIGGTQDNGTQYMNGRGNSPKAGERLLVNFSLADGGHADISWLRPKVMFAENQNGDLGRSDDEGESIMPFYSALINTARSSGLSNWIMPYKLWETTNDAGSYDTSSFTLIPGIRSMGYGDGVKKIFKGKIRHGQSTVEFIPQSFKVEAGAATMICNASGVVSGDGVGVFHADSGYFEVTFNSPPLAEVIMKCDVYIPSGSKIVMQSKIGGLPIPFTTTSRLDVNQTVKAQDKIQSTFFIGLGSGTSASTGIKLGGIFMTRGVHDFSGTPEWWQIAHLQGKGTPLSMEVSKDGNHLFVGTTAGYVFRISNLQAARKKAQASIDSVSKYVITVTQIGNFNSRSVTGVAVDPNNNDRVAITLGNYGNTNYVYYCSNATSATPSFIAKQGNLPTAPAYCLSFDKGGSDKLYVGTELGLYACANINTTPTWVEENTGMGRVAVFGIRQYRTDELHDPNRLGSQATEGELYIATHGRGFFKTANTSVSRPVGQNENLLNASRVGLKVFPNPANDYVYIATSFVQPTEVTMTLRGMDGRLVKQVRVGRIDASVDRLKMDLTGIRKGNYLLSVLAGSSVESTVISVY